MGSLLGILMVFRSRDVVGNFTSGSQIRWGRVSTLFSTNLIGQRMVLVQVTRCAISRLSRLYMCQRMHPIFLPYLCTCLRPPAILAGNDECPEKNLVRETTGRDGAERYEVNCLRRSRSNLYSN